MPPTRLQLRALLCPSLTIGASLGLVDVAAALVRKRAMRVKAGGVPVEILGFDVDEGSTVVSLGPSSLAEHPGPVILWNTDKSSVCTLGNVLSSSSSAVLRPVQGVLPPGFLGESSGLLYGHIGQTPSDLGLRYEDTLVGTSTGWLIPPIGPARAKDTWAIHVHGLGGGRNQTLRGLPVFSRAGVTSLVPTLGISLDRGETHDRLGSFGTKEVAALEAAHDYAIAHGASKVIFVGWSYGALAVMRAMASRRWTDVSGLVLLSPALDWKLIISSGLEGAGIRSSIARLVMARFNSPIARQGAAREVWDGVEGDVETVLSGWPALILHGDEDTLVPRRQSLSLSQRFRGTVDAYFFPASHHGMEWNSAQEAWEEIVGAWVATH